MAFEIWTITAVANGITVILYAAIATIIFRGVHQGRQWRTNPIAVATAAIFATCAVGHGLHVLHVIPPFSLFEPAEAVAGKAMFSEWRLVVWDGLTGSIAIWYWVLRNRFAIVYQGGSLCEDMSKRQAEANVLQQKVVEGLTQAQAELDAGAREHALRTMSTAIEDGKTIITTLMGDGRTHRGVKPGDLKRGRASE